jgi:DNA-binding NarL/FixJ family response regulator
MNKIRILVVDDHPLMRRALINTLSLQADFEVVGEAGNGEEALTQARRLKPDVIVMDLSMPVKDGLQATSEITHLYPGMHVLALTSSLVENSAMEAIEAGVLGFLGKDAHPDDILHALREVSQGREYWPTAPTDLARGLSEHREQRENILTSREEDVLAFIGEGLSNKEIAERMYLSESTVRAHVYHILKKLNLHNRTQAALYLQRQRKSPNL